MSQRQRMQEATIFEDSRFIVVNKPSGVAVHGVQGDRLGVIETIRALRPNAPYLELAHRLDRDTSGCLVIAKRRSALRAFQQQQENRGVDKHYLALVRGQWKGAHRKVGAPLFKTVLKSGGWLIRVDETKGKRAVSYFSPVERFEQATLMRVKIITGRTHQIRVHARHISFPIAGDLKYGDESFNRDMEALGFKRMCLHAEFIRFTIPEVQSYDVQAALPPDITSSMGKLIRL